MYTLTEFINENKKILVYHGTYYKFDNFNTIRKINGFGYSMGTYFSDNIKEAERYGNIINSYNIKFDKLLDLSFIPENDNTGKEQFFNYMKNKLNIHFKNEKLMIYSNPYFGYTTLESLDRHFNLVPKLKLKSIDGISFNEGNGITYVVFNNNQVKKIIN